MQRESESGGSARGEMGHARRPESGIIISGSPLGSVGVRVLERAEGME